MLYAIFGIISSITGMVGAFTSNKVLFTLGGGVSFALCLIYIVLKVLQKDSEQITEIKATRCYQRTKSSQVYYAENDEEG